MRLVLFIFILFLLKGFNLKAQQRVIDGSVIKSRDNWSGNVLVRGDVIIGKNARLTIDPGTQIRFQPQDNAKGGSDKTRIEIIVYGVIIVKGTVENKVLFTSASSSPQMGDWYGLFNYRVRL